MVPKPVKSARKPVSFRRLGPGRPANLPATPVSEAEIERVAATGETAAQMARHHAARAVAVLLQVAETGANEAARVTAARALVAMGNEAVDPVPMSASEIEWDKMLNS